MNKKIHLILIVLVLMAGSSVVPAQRIDPDFTTDVKKDIPVTAGGGSVLLALPGNKTLALLVNSTTRSLLRFDADGISDISFNCAACNFEMRTIAVQPDGKYLVGGISNGSSRLIRINTDGSLDPSFVNFFGNGDARVHLVTAAGQIYASLSGASLRRLNSDGSFDNSFTPQSLGANGGIIRIMERPNGKILVFGYNLPGGRVFQLNVDGTNDTGWTKPVLAHGSYPPRVPGVTLSDAFLLPDGKVVLVGQFGGVNNVFRRNIARLNPDGTVDSAPAPDIPWSYQPDSRFMLQSDGKLIIYTDGNQTSSAGFWRLNTDFTIDNTFNTYFTLLNSTAAMTVNDNDQVTFLSGGNIKRLNTDGTQDNTIAFTSRGPGPVSSIVPQADGKTVIAGNFKYIDGVTQPAIARLNADGTRDASFVTGTGFNSFPSKIALQPDGKILAFGNFTSYNGVPRTGVARLNSDGSLDASFAPDVSGGNSFTVQPDGKMLLFGGNITVNGSSRTGLARLNSDGTLDTPFNPVIGSPTINGAVVYPDGRITIAGSFASVNGVNRSNLARLNTDGTVDTTLNAGNIGALSLIALVPNGQYIVTRGMQVYRVNSDGLVDPSFVSPAIEALGVKTILPEAGGFVTLGGTFTSPRANILKLRVNGALDNTFFPAGASGPVLALARQADGRVLAGGEFATIGGVSRRSMARIIAAYTPFDFDGDGRADFMVTRPSDFNWYLLTNWTYNYTAVHLGSPGDKVVPADYDGDGKTDIATWRPSTGEWSWQSSLTGAVSSRTLGTNGDTPVPSDTDGSGKADFVVVTPGGLWKGIDVATGNVIVSYQFSSPGDQPVAGDFDGDGKFDLAYFRPSNGTWYYNRSSIGVQTVLIPWGIAGDIPAPADYDGDGITDAAVFRPSEGNWYVRRSSAGPLFLHFGATGDKPVPADYDGDGKADIAVFRPSDGYWYQLPTTGGYTGLPWGIGSDIPSPNALMPFADPPR